MLKNEDLLDLKEAGQHARCSANAVWRWCRKGVVARSGRRVRLEHIRSPRKILTSREAIQRFFAAIAAEDFADEPAA